MKNRKISMLILVTSVAIMAFSGCKKNDGGVTNRVSITDVPVITTNIDPTGSQAIDMLNLAAFSGKFKVDIYFPGATPPTKVDIVARKNGSNTNVKLYKANVTTFPSTYTVTAADLATLFGAPVVLGDSYDFAPDIYVGETKFEAFPAPVGGVNVLASGTGHANMHGYGEFARFAAICAYNPAIYEGNFVVVSDAFGELAAGTIVTLTRVDNTSFRVSYPNPALTPQPTSFLASVNTLNNVVTVASQQIGTNFYQYTNPRVATGGAVSNVTPCDREIRIGLTYNVAQGSFGGPFVLRLRKQ